MIGKTRKFLLYAGLYVTLTVAVFALLNMDFSLVLDNAIVIDWDLQETLGRRR